MITITRLPREGDIRTRELYCWYPRTFWLWDAATGEAAQCRVWRERVRLTERLRTSRLGRPFWDIIAIEPV